MSPIYAFRATVFADLSMKPFILQETPTVDALKNMGGALSKELRSLLVYYGENPDSPDAPKPEDFFNLIASFSSSLQVCNSVSELFSLVVNLFSQKCAVEVHDAEVRLKLSRTPSTTRLDKSLAPSQQVAIELGSIEQDHTRGRTIKGQHDGDGNGSKPSGESSSGNGSVGRGDLDQAIRTMREGKRRNRPPRPLSKIFLDGGNGAGRPHSRLFD